MGIGARAMVLAVAAMLAGVLVGSASPAGAGGDPDPAPGTQLVEICSTSGVIDFPEIGPRTCASFEAGSVVFAQICNQLPLPAEACASLTDGRTIDTSVIDAYEQSWVHRALRLQELLDRGEPLRNSLVPHTHNSANSTAYAPSLTILDPNQRFTIGDQLRMDIRGIELDLHWAPSASGTPETGGKAVLLCHGRSEGVDELIIHVGCSNDQPFANGLVEIRDFLTAEGNDEVVVLLYLENQLDKDPQAHRQASATIEEIIGDLVLRPPPGTGDGTCADAPMDGSRQDVLDAGKQIVIVGDCGPGPWGTWVHERGPLWNESSHDGSYPEPGPDACDPDRAERDYDANFIRHWEDLTFLTAMVDGGSDPITPEVTNAMVRCGVDMIGFDELGPDDGRLEALVWSWAPDEPSLEPGLECAARGTDGRFRMDGCSTVRPFSCRTAAGDWVVPESTGPWGDGEAVCAAAGASFTVPPTGWENERLGAVAASATEGVWIPIGIADVGGTPTATPPAAAPDAGSDGGTGGGALPATGGPSLLLVGVAALAAGAVVRRRR